MSNRFICADARDPDIRYFIHGECLTITCHAPDLKFPALFVFRPSRRYELAHYAYLVGQLVYIGKMKKGHSWRSLSIAPGVSKQYNEGKFSKPESDAHFTDEFLKKK